MTLKRIGHPTRPQTKEELSGLGRDGRVRYAPFPQIPGFLLLVAGWGLVMAAVVLLKLSGARTAFVLAGVGVQIAGLVLVIRSHVSPREERP